MPLYRLDEEVISRSVQTFVKAKLLAFHNPADTPPYLTVIEGKAEIRDDGKVYDLPDMLGDLEDIIVPFDESNKDEVFNILDSETGDTVDTMTYSQLYSALYSLYFHLANKRDETT